MKGGIALDSQQIGFGLDEASGPAQGKPGRVIGCENFEIVFGDFGMRRINGYERYDGRAAPSDATYYTVAFDAGGTTAIAVGNTITTASGSAYVLRVSVASGSWAGSDAAGTLIVTALTGTIADNETISVSASPRATASADIASASSGDTAYASDLVLARTYYRDLIAKPTGEGAILGVAIYNGTVYCLRNVVGSATATLWKSTASGWSAVRTGLRPGGTLRTVVANFTGVTRTKRLFGCDGENRYWAWDGTTFTFGPAVYATEGTSTTSLTPGTGSKAFTTTETGRSFTGGKEMIAYSAADASNYMIGTVSSSTGSSVTLNVTSFGGTTANDWHICRTDGVDRPTTLTEHKNFLMLAYPQGQLQTSDVGEPLVFGASSTAFGLGDEITDLASLRGDVLAVFGENKISLLYGDNSGASPWQMKRHTQTSNTKAGSAIEVGGDAIFIADAGVLTLAGAQDFGDFNAANVADPAMKTLRDILQDYRCSSLVKSDSQYRIYGNASQVLVMTFAGGRVNPETVRFTRLRYAHQPSCAASDTTDGKELIVFGTDDGWVMRERVGTTFDGATFEAFFRTSYWHAKSPQHKKRFRKILLDIDSGTTAVDLYFRQDIDFTSPDDATPYLYPVAAGGGAYDAAYWDEFFWDGAEATQVHASVDGIGRYMSVLVYCSGDIEPFLVRGMHWQFSVLGLQR